MYKFLIWLDIAILQPIIYSNFFIYLLHIDIPYVYTNIILIFSISFSFYIKKFVAVKLIRSHKYTKLDILKSYLYEFFINRATDCLKHSYNKKNMPKNIEQVERFKIIVVMKRIYIIFIYIVLILHLFNVNIPIEYSSNMAVITIPYFTFIIHPRLCFKDLILEDLVNCKLEEIG